MSKAREYNSDIINKLFNEITPSDLEKTKMKMLMKLYIEERNLFYAQNISEFEIGDDVKDFDGKLCKIVNKTSNSIEVFIGRKSNAGVDVKNWFEMKFFNSRFKKI